MTIDADKPIIVNGAVLPSTLAAALRYAIALGGPLLIQRGILPADSLEGVTTIIVTAATVGYGLWKTHQRKSQLVTVAEAAPNSVAVVTGT